jgi:betaine reductase
LKVALCAELRISKVLLKLEPRYIETKDCKHKLSLVRRIDMRVVHYLNQFFGGVGGEEFASTGISSQEGAIGPGRLLQKLLGEESEVVTTVICGDNYAAENLDEITEYVVNAVKAAKADLFVAGPCFEAGRYGVAAGAVCAAVSAQLNIPVVTGMAEENPGVDLFRQEIYIIDSGANVGAMSEVLGSMAVILNKLNNDEEMGSPEEEGYIPQGIVRDAILEENAATRILNMIIAKTKGEDYKSELTQTAFEPVPAPPAVKDLTNATIAVVTDGGLVPKGNPDNMPPIAAEIWGSYDIASLDDLEEGDYEVQHRGYDNRHVLNDPDRLVPVDILRELEKAGKIGKVYKEFLSTSGLANPIANSRRLGQEMAKKLKDAGVDAVILTST